MGVGRSFHPLKLPPSVASSGTGSSLPPAVTPRLSMAEGDWKEQDAVSLLQALARPTALARPAAVNLGKRGQPSQQLAQFHDETPVVVSKCWGHQLSPLTRCNLDFTPGRNHFVRECDSNPRSGLCTDALAS